MVRVRAESFSPAIHLRESINAPIGATACGSNLCAVSSMYVTMLVILLLLTQNVPSSPGGPPAIVESAEKASAGFRARVLEETGSPGLKSDEHKEKS